jgi:hypothetical protein
VVEIKNRSVRKESKVRSYPDLTSASIQRKSDNEAVAILLSEGGEVFYNYVDSLGLSQDPYMIVLSSSHHYYYDCDEMKMTKTVINLKELNRIEEISDLLHSHLPSLPDQCSFIGCFVNNRKVERFALRKSRTPQEIVKNSDKEELGIVSRFPFMNMLFSILDSTTDSYMSDKIVMLLLESNGFKVLNMREINGLTYFHSRKVSESYN